MRFIVMLVGLFVCGTVLVGAQADGNGTLEIRANGEDFVRQGFVSKDGWSIQFDQVVVALTNIRVYQTDPPYDPFAGELTRSQVMVGLPGQHIVDLAAGDADAEPLLVGTVEAAPAGYYNAISWMLTPAADGEFAGSTVVMVGSATRDDQTVRFTLRIDEPYAYTCGAFVGDERKGILQADAVADVEMTFHFDHIFGDADLPLDDSLNQTAPGFDMFALLAADGRVDVTLSDLQDRLSSDDYTMLVDILPSLGHVGEGHCHEY